MTGLDHKQLSETLEILKHPHRRHLLYQLRSEPEPVAIEQIAREIVNWEAADPQRDGPSDPSGVEIGLRHIHLPKLADAGVISVSPNPGNVSLRETNGVNEFLDLLADVDGLSIPKGSD